MPPPRINFGNLEDGVDWANAIPPHILSQQEQLLLRQRQPPRPRTMFAPWPLADDAFPVPVPVSVTIRPNAHRTPSLRQSGARRGAVVVSSSTRPNSLLALTLPLAERQRSVLAEAPSLHGPLGFGPTLFGLDVSDPWTQMEQMEELAVAQLHAATRFAESMSRLSVPPPSPLHRSESRPSTVASQFIADVSNNTGAPTRRIVRTEWRSADGRGRVRHHISESSSNYDIITGRERHAPLNRARPMRQSTSSQRRSLANQDWEISDMSYENLLRLDDAAVPAGLSQYQLRQMKAKSYASRKEGPDNVESCTICLEELHDGVLVLDLPCGHTFHQKCLSKWLTQRNCCPTCRHEIPRQSRTR